MDFVKNTTAIGYTANGKLVFSCDESHSHRPDLDKEVISKIEIPSDTTFVRTTIDLGRVIGKDHLVKTDENDTIVWLQRGNRPGKSRMVLKPAEDTSFVTVILALCAEKEEGNPDVTMLKWILVTLFEGQPGEREPFDRAFVDGKNPEGLKKAEEFWTNHALVPTEEELRMLDGVMTAEQACAIAKMLLKQMDLDFMEYVQVECAVREDIVDSAMSLDPFKTIDEIRELIEHHRYGYRINPDGYDY